MRKIGQIVTASSLVALSTYACSVDNAGHTATGGNGAGGAASGGKSSSGGHAGTASGGMAARGGSGALGGAAGAQGGNAGGAGGSEGGELGTSGAPDAGAAGDLNQGGAASGGAAGSGSGGAATAGTGGASNGCDSNPCLNGGSCKAGTLGSYTCTCTKRFSGAHCEAPKFSQLNMWATALSHDGKLAVGQACYGRWVDCPPVKASTSGGAPTPLLLPSGLPSGVTVPDGCQATAVNGDGSWIGGHCALTGSTSFYGGVEWPNSGTAGKYVQGRSADEFIVELRGANTDGSIVVGTLQTSTSQGSKPERMFRRIPTSGVVPIENVLAPDERGYANAVSPDGLTVIGSSDGHPVRWNPSSGFKQLAELDNSPPDYNQSYSPRDISADGSVIVGVFMTRGGPTALRWKGDSVQSLGNGTANAVNADGSLVVGTSITGACAWDKLGNVQGMLDLIDDPVDTAGWELGEAIAMSKDGKVVLGTGVKDGNYWSWVARLP